MRVLIMGCGRVGATIAQAMAEEGHSVTVVDTDPESFRRLPQVENIEALEGDGTLEEDLRRAGITDADVFVAVAQRDTRNALAGQLAHHIFNIPRVVFRINDPTRQEMYQSLGLEAVCSTRVTSEQIMEAIHR